MTNTENVHPNVPLKSELADAQLSLECFEVDVDNARRRRNAAVLAMLNNGSQPRYVAELLGVSRAAVSKMKSAAIADRAA